MERIIRVFTDGSAIGNPGPGGWGAVVIEGKKRREIVRGLLMDQHLGDGTSRGRRGAPLATHRIADRAALGLRVAHPWYARSSLPLAAPGMAGWARCGTPAPGPLASTPSLELRVEHSMEVATRA